MTEGRKKVLVTGGAGLIGSILIDKLGGDYEISSFDRQEADGVRSFVGDLTDLDALTKACEGQDYAVHLAADPNMFSEWESNRSNNFEGTYNLFEAAKRGGVNRVVFASSNHATGGYYLDEPWKFISEGKFDRLEAGKYPLVDESYRIRPDGYYGTAKAFGEALGSYYTDYHNVSSIHLRIGWVMRGGNPKTAPYSLGLALWLSHRDCAQIVQRSIEAPKSLRYGVFYATSDNTWKVFSIERAKKMLGYAPQDDAGSEWTPQETR